MVDIKKINELVDELIRLAGQLGSIDKDLLHSTIIAIRHLSGKLIEVEMDNKNMKHYIDSQKEKECQKS